MKHYSIRTLIVSLVLVLAMAFTVAGCTFGPDNGGGGPNDGDGSTDQSIPTPEMPDIDVIAPETSQPEADDGDLLGDADTSGADAVITLTGASAEFTGSNVKVVESDIYGTIVEISKSGTYVVQGTLTQGFVAVSKKELTVTIILNGVNIYCSNYAAITCLKRSAVTIELAENSTNYLTDGAEYYDNAEDRYDEDETPNAALLIRTDLTIRGSGKLIVNGNCNNGIGSRANLTIEGGDISVNAVNNALKGNDSITISGGTLTLISSSDGIKSEDDDALGEVGDINITGGTLVIAAVNDAVQAAANLSVANAALKLKTGGGSAAAATSASAKGLKATIGLTVVSGDIDIDSNDDSLHAVTVTIEGGALTCASGDDGIHADETLTVNGGTINISKSYEGLEAKDIGLNGGSVRVKSTDDGVNISGGKDSSATNRPGQGGARPGQPSAGSTAASGTLTVTGGIYYVDASGDGLDSNGSIVMSGGTVIVFGPTSGGDAAIDYDGTFKITGGTLISLGSSGMAQQPGSTSTQYSF
ncbi:MAG: carbohydrate-binding domain-containing protein, partial [Clostridiales bacterium]|nr:carbohydrate-binding domain-containing protein [Clostridiales bacterium]